MLHRGDTVRIGLRRLAHRRIRLSEYALAVLCGNSLNPSIKSSCWTIQSHAVLLDDIANWLHPTSREVELRGRPLVHSLLPLVPPSPQRWPKVTKALQ